MTELNKPPFDARRVANLLLDLADERGVSVSNLSLQKILFFAHAYYLCERSEPLVEGEFEAWQYGPVHRIAYRAFRMFDAAPIKCRAKAMNPRTLRDEPIPDLSDVDTREYLAEIFDFFGFLGAGTLVSLSHEPGSPWSNTWRDSATRPNVGMRIQNRTVVDYYARHVRPTRKRSLHGETRTSHN